MRSLLFSLLLPIGLSAQAISLTGTVIDAAYGSPLSFVSVFLKSNQSRGVLTNERGEYVSKGDTLVKIQYGLRPDYGELSEAEQRTLAHYFTGEVLINKSDYAMVRNTQGEVDKGWYRDVVYKKVNGKYYPKKISAEVQYEYNNRTQTTYQTNLLYVTEVITGTKAVKKSKKGKLLDMEGKLATIKADYDPDFWAKNEILQLLPAPEALQSGLEN